MSQLGTNKFIWIVAVAISVPVIWVGMQNLVAQDADPFGESTPPPAQESTEDPFGESTPPQSQEDPFGESTPAESTPPTESSPFGEPEAEPIPAETPDTKQVPDDTDPFGEGSGTSNPVDDPASSQGGDLPNNSSPFGEQGVEAPFGGQKASEEDPFGEGTTDSGQPSGNANTDPANENNTFAAGEFEVEFWRYLTANNYKNWAPAPNQNGDFYSGKSPHGLYLKMYLNRTAISNPNELPNGSVIVKENFGLDKSLKAITVMYRSSGYNPKGKDWYWVKYNPDGTVAKTGVEEGAMKIAGASKDCMECHQTADGDDFIFFND